MSTIAITATLESLYSRRDRNGNCYWALRFTDHATGRVVTGTVSGGESNINGIRVDWKGRGTGWDASIQTRTEELPIREFNRLTKSWEYAGCTPDDLRAFIRARLA